jgi:PPOX class probable F420-dependent enzyme
VANIAAFAALKEVLTMTNMSDFGAARTPTVDRPHFPTGYISPDILEELLPWDHARERLEAAKVYWIASVRPNGRPHVSPVWGIWLDERLFFDGSPETRRMRNIAANPAIAVHLDSRGDGAEVVTLEGEARELKTPERTLTERIAAAYAAKYVAERYAPSPDTWDNGGLYVMPPTIVIAWTNFQKNPTRWRFR